MSKRWSYLTYLLALFGALLVPPDAAAQATPAAEPAAAKAGTAAAAASDSSPADPAVAEEPDPWPRRLDGTNYTYEIHLPQIESWNGHRLEALSAILVEEKANKTKYFGTVSYSARTRVEKEERMVVIDQLVVDSIRFPSAPETEKNFATFLQKRFGSKVKTVALDRLESAALAAARREELESKTVLNAAPAVVFAERPTLLIYVDGDPVWQKVEGTGYERLINTRPLLLRDAGESVHLHLFDGWLTGSSLDGPWTVATATPAGIDAAAKAALSKQGADLLDGGSDPKSEVDADGRPIPQPALSRGPIPDVVIATAPTELVIFDGAPTWVPIAGTRLEYAGNTTGNLFRWGGTSHFILLSGRWFSASTLAGPWRWVPQRELVDDFRSIPDESPKENVKASVAGTPQAEEALIADGIPQTSEVNRKSAKFEAAYDGEPKFEPIEGTKLAHAGNSPKPVIQVAPDRYYAVDNAVWFTGKSPKGPWKVAVTIPEEIYSIPPSSPIHYVTYARIYGSTKDVVIAGYTPGYYGTVVSDGVVVFGTGYDYEPWIDNYWFGAPATWGYASAITYTPWNGWSYGYGMGWGWGYWGGWYAPYPGPYWGPYYGYGYGYGYPYYGGVIVGSGGGYAAWGPGGWAGTTGNIYRQYGSTSSATRYSGGYNAWTGNAWRGQVGAAYNSRTGNIAAGQRGAVANVYTGEYAYGGRGAARNANTGNTVAGGRVTMGDADTGRQVTAGRAGAYNPTTGEGGTAGWVRGEQGGVARVGDDYYAAKDGQVYRRDGQGSWSQVERGGQWNGVSDSARTRDLTRQSSARSMGSQRYNGNRYSSPGFSGGRMRGGGGRFR